MPSPSHEATTATSNPRSPAEPDDWDAGSPSSTDGPPSTTDEPDTEERPGHSGASPGGSGSGSGNGSGTTTPTTVGVQPRPPGTTTTQPSTPPPDLLRLLLDLLL